jgi:anaerobic selenocysteine-containing dehydrogenase
MGNGKTGAAGSETGVVTAREVKETACPLDCPDACSLDVTVEDGRVTAITGNRINPVTDGFICSKVRDFGKHLYHETRLRRPLIREGDSPKGQPQFREARWDEALTLITERMRATLATSGGEAILPFSYGGSNGRLTQDSTDLALFRRLGASRLLQTVCAAPTSSAALGLYGKMPGVSFEDYEHAQLIVVWGANPSASHIHLVPIIKRAQKAGAKLVVVDPRAIQLARSADLHLAPRPGTDLPLALAVIRWLFENGHADREFLAAHATGVDELEKRAAEWTLERAAEVCGLEASSIETLARMYAEASPAVLRCGWGLERNRNGGSAACAILALPAVAGKFGQRGGGFTLSNNRSFAFPPVFDDPEPDTREINMNRLGRALLEEVAPPIEVLFVYNCNPLSTMPNQAAVRKGLEREDLFTVVFDQVMTDTARYADVVLPATTFLEHADLNSGYGAYVLSYTEPVIDPVEEARPNYAVFAELLQRLDLWRPGDEQAPRDLLRRAAPQDGEGGEMLARLQNGELVTPGFGSRPIQFADVLPWTVDEKIHLVPPELDQEAPLGLYGFQEDPGTRAHPLALISPGTARTISSTLGQLHEKRVPLGIHPQDAQARGIEDGARVRVFNELGEVRTHAQIDPNLRPGVVHLPKGIWGHNTDNGNTSNTLSPDTLTDLGRGACFNDARVEVEQI